MGSTQRERDARRALDDLGIDRFVAFIEAVKDSGVLAPSFFVQSLEDGESIEEIFFDGSEYGYRVGVAPLADNRYEIEFGCLVDGTAGDGGEWEVTFDDDAAVIVVEGAVWMA